VSDRPRVIALVVVAASAWYVVTLVAAPFIDRSIDVLRAHPEDYVHGPAGALVIAGYWSVALMALLIAGTLVAGDWRDRLASVLLLAGALTSISLAIAPAPVTGGPLLVGVLGLAIAPPLLALAHAHGPWIERALGIGVLALFLALVFAPGEVGGVVNRAFDIVLGAWGAAIGVHHYRERATMRP
jgi:hypothetical protein